MNSYFLSVKELGDLYIKQVIVQYDYPLLFICEDQFDSLYILNEISDSDDCEAWIASKITRKKYIDILESRISLREAFNNGVDVPYIIIKHYFIPESVSCEFIYNPMEDFFPEDDVYMSTFCGDLRLINYDSTTDADIFEVEAYPGKSVGGMDIAIHNSVCSAICGIVEGLFGKDVDVKLMVPKASSYSIQFMITSHDRGIIESHNAIKKISDAISIADKDSLSDSKNKIMAMEQSKKFFSSMAKTKDDFIFVYYGDGNKKVFNKFSYSDTLERITKLSDDIIDILDKEKEMSTNDFMVEGKLLAFDLLKKEFSIQYVEEEIRKNTFEKKYKYLSGKLSTDLSEGQFVGFEFSYEASIREIKENGKRVYELLSLAPQAKLDFN